MNDEYAIMSSEEALDLDVSGLKQVQRQPGHQYPWTRYLSFTLVLVVILSMWSLALKNSTISYHTPDHGKAKGFCAGMELVVIVFTAKTAEFTTTWANFWWHTSYSSKGKNKTESDDLWEQISPSHGFVAIDREWAGESQWPVSMYLPSDHSKGVYLLEAYHQLHCLVRLTGHSYQEYRLLNFKQRILRKTFWEAVERRPFTYHVSHSDHCFDALRQVRMYPKSLITSLFALMFKLESLSYVTQTTRRSTPLVIKQLAMANFINAEIGTS